VINYLPDETIHKSILTLSCDGQQSCRCTRQISYTFD